MLTIALTSGTRHFNSVDQHSQTRAPMSLNRLFRRRTAAPEPAEALYLSVVRQSRQPAFYASLGVPDTLDGRFDMIVLHVVLVLLRLKREVATGERIGQALFDVLFADMDRSLREMGVGDLGVGKRVKQMGKAAYGRLAAYEAALSGEAGALDAAITRNLYGTVEPAALHVAGMTRYVLSAVAALQDQTVTTLAAGQVSFPSPEDAVRESR